MDPMMWVFFGLIGMILTGCAIAAYLVLRRY